MARVYLKKYARYPQQETQILRYVEVLLEDRGSKDIHGGIPKGGPILISGGNN